LQLTGKISLEFDFNSR